MGDLSLFLLRLTLSFTSLTAGRVLRDMLSLLTCSESNIHIVVFIKIIGLGSFANASWRIVWLMYLLSSGPNSLSFSCGFRALAFGVRVLCLA
jgi:hypothetical protein